MPHEIISEQLASPCPELFRRDKDISRTNYQITKQSLHNYIKQSLREMLDE